MSSYRYKPSKPLAVFGAVFGAAILVFGIIMMLNSEGGTDDGGGAFLVLWCVAGVAIIGINLWAAFSKNGSLATFVKTPDEDADRAG